MSEIAIKVENISKQYRLGVVGTGTLSHDLNRWWHRLRGKEDPYLTVGEVNERSVAGVSEYVWALKDISIEIKKGEIVGIIGRNGAGKSTLLKILSRTTTPTKGTVKAKGRIASLLEVGTGFHPELSGRENIFLNGAILGMPRSEIQRKLDEIVYFSGVERYIDTPVKRYSSGMYVRLAFAVAAHLEADILIVDEVLAVGDAEFQQKCIGKMQDVSSQSGRTILFVSHNLTSIRTLCSKGVLINNGKIDEINDVDKVISKYNEQFTTCNLQPVVKSFSNLLQIQQVVVNSNNTRLIKLSPTNNEIKIEVTFLLLESLTVSAELKMYDSLGLPLAFVSPFQENGKGKKYSPGLNKIILIFDFPERANKGKYYLNLALSHPGVMVYSEIEQAFTVAYEGYNNDMGNSFFYDNGAGFLFLKTKVVI